MSTIHIDYIPDDEKQNFKQNTQTKKNIPKISLHHYNPSKSSERLHYMFKIFHYMTGIFHYTSLHAFKSWFSQYSDKTNFTKISWIHYITMKLWIQFLKIIIKNPYKLLFYIYISPVLNEPKACMGSCISCMLGCLLVWASSLLAARASQAG